MAGERKRAHGSAADTVRKVSENAQNATQALRPTEENPLYIIDYNGFLLGGQGQNRTADTRIFSSYVNQYVTDR